LVTLFKKEFSPTSPNPAPNCLEYSLVVTAPSSSLTFLTFWCFGNLTSLVSSVAVVETIWSGYAELMSKVPVLVGTIFYDSTDDESKRASDSPLYVLKAIFT